MRGTRGRRVNAADQRRVRGSREVVSDTGASRGTEPNTAPGAWPRAHGVSRTRGCAAAGPGADSAWPLCQPGTETRSWAGPLASTFLRMVSLDVTSTQAQRWHQNLTKGGSKQTVTRCPQQALSRGSTGSPRQERALVSACLGTSVQGLR